MKKDNSKAFDSLINLVGHRPLLAVLGDPGLSGKPSKSKSIKKTPKPPSTKKRLPEVHETQALNASDLLTAFMASLDKFSDAAKGGDSNLAEQRLSRFKTVAESGHEIVEIGRDIFDDYLQVAESGGNVNQGMIGSSLVRICDSLATVLGTFYSRRCRLQISVKTFTSVTETLTVATDRKHALHLGDSKSLMTKHKLMNASLVELATAGNYFTKKNCIVVGIRRDMIDGSVHLDGVLYIDFLPSSKGDIIVAENAGAEDDLLQVLFLHADALFVPLKLLRSACTRKVTKGKIIVYLTNSEDVLEIQRKTVQSWQSQAAEGGNDALAGRGILSLTN